MGWNLQEFCEQVGVMALEYGVEDGADLCHHLIETGVIDPNGMGADYAAQAVAQHALQA